MKIKILKQLFDQKDWPVVVVCTIALICWATGVIS